MKAYYRGSARGREWCCVSGTDENTDNDAIECAKHEYGFDWMMPVFASERPEDWPSNPKKSWDGSRTLWLLVRT